MNDTAAAPAPVYRFAFTGSATEYFRIWAVSLFLTLLSLGIYSAWGKVRKRRYLYAHTRLAGSGFEYRASPVAILRGRAIALALLGGLALAGHFVPAAQLALFALLIALTPWIVVASSRFNARNSAWRNVAFAFDGRVGEAAKVILGFGALAVVTLGLGYPYARMRRARFIVERHRFGATPFRAQLLTGDFILAYLFASLLLIGAVALYAGASVATFALAGGSGGNAPPLLILGPMLLLYVSYVGVFAYLRARIGNATLNGTRVGGLRCVSTLRARDLTWLYATNIVAILATLGLATPWATIRLARYRAEQLAVEGGEALATLAAADARAGTATGSEVGDLFDVDVSL